jgi:osmotically-inducible protein OsmY
MRSKKLRRWIPDTAKSSGRAGQGRADSAAAKELAGVLALNSHGVVEVDNRLLVQPPAPGANAKMKATSAEVGQNFSDGWITTKVRSTLMYPAMLTAQQSRSPPKVGWSP